MRYFQIGWALFEMLCRWGDARSAAELIARVNAETTLDLTQDDVRQAVSFLRGSELLRIEKEEDTKRLLGRYCDGQKSLLKQLVHNYLFFRIPLFKPDRALAYFLPKVRFLGSALFAIITLCVLVAGLILISRQWAQVLAGLEATLTVVGLFGYAIAVAIAKLVHELGHAFVAKAYGCRVATMGLAFLVLYPVPYTDTNDAWKLRSRQARLSIAGAGMLAEFYVAAWATFVWAFLPDGSVRSAVLMLAATTWVLSVLVNASPIMRFDGYYLLSDFLNTPNLHDRSFAFGRWFLREVLFDLKEPPPEQSVRSERIFYIAFSYVVWLVRLIVFIGIALLVYQFFFKALGVLLFCIEIAWFIAFPVAREWSAWWSRRSLIVRNSRFWLSLCSFIGFVALLFVPVLGSIYAPAMLRSERVQLIFPAANSEIAALHATEGEIKKAGDFIVSFSSSLLDYQARDNQAKISLLQKQLQMASFDERFRAQTQLLREQISAAEAERTSLMEQIRRLHVFAPFDARVYDLAADLEIGQSVNQKQKIASLRAVANDVAIGFVREEEIYRLSVGQDAWFYPETSGRSRIRMTIRRIETTPVASVEIPALSSNFGGPIESFLKTGREQPRGVLYKVVAEPVQTDMVSEVEMRGTLRIHAVPESIASKFVRAAVAVLVRESTM